MDDGAKSPQIRVLVNDRATSLSLRPSALQTVPRSKAKLPVLYVGNWAQEASDFGRPILLRCDIASDFVENMNSVTVNDGFFYDGS